ncbi:MAG: Holliday junction branch migration DNA helicase RuvB [Planctomycetota bacterium]|nr:Holliday junction branch migration DNA helicase RuvB [Planctomycetota bacterium]
MDEERFASSSPDNKSSEVSLRPRHFSAFVGQKRVVRNLKVYIEAARKRNTSLDHILLSGPPGLGKTTLAAVISNELGVQLRTTACPVVEKPADLAGLLTNLKRGDVLFIDEIHRLPTAVEEYLYSAMEDFSIDIMIDTGPAARSVTIEVPPFTLIGATTREGLLTAPFRARFGVHERLNYYSIDELHEIITRAARLMKISVEEDGSQEIARRSRGTPRIATRYLRRIRDVAEVLGNSAIDLETASRGLEMMGIDAKGLDPLDRHILETLYKQDGGPVGLKTISVVVGEQPETIENVYEPYLIQLGFVTKTSRGRKLTADGYEHLGKEPAGESASDVSELF